MEKSVDIESESSKLDIKEQIKAYLKENLDINVSTNGGRIVVDLELEGEQIASSSEYICDILNEKDNW